MKYEHKVLKCQLLTTQSNNLLITEKIYQYKLHLLIKVEMNTFNNKKNICNLYLIKYII